MVAWPEAEQLLSDAIHFLIQGDERDAALLLLSCEAEYNADYRNTTSFAINLLGPREAYTELKSISREDFIPSPVIRDDSYAVELEWQAANTMHDKVDDAFKAVAPPGSYFVDFRVSVKFADIQLGWREQLLEEVHGRRVHNQGVAIQGSEIIEWGNMRFRSQTEVRVAKALDTVGVLFLPNCLVRLNKGNTRITQESDFLVCQNGKWGILEADGGPYHQQAARDHDRDRLFRQHGIKVIERFTAEECYNDAPGVVRKFLTLLERNG
jgi:hypothetical protein